MPDGGAVTGPLLFEAVAPELVGELAFSTFGGEALAGAAAAELADTAATTGFLDPTTKSMMDVAFPAGAADGALGASQSNAPITDLSSVAGSNSASTAASGNSWFERLKNNPWAAMKEMQAVSGGSLGAINNVSSLYSGIKGLRMADQLTKLGTMGAQNADAWGASGGRMQAAQQLQGALSSPDAYNNSPMAKARMLAVQRAMAPYGDSGNLAAAAAASGGAGWADYMQTMGGLAGVGNASVGGNLALSGASAGADLTSRALATFAYGGQRAIPSSVPGASQNWYQV